MCPWRGGGQRTQPRRRPHCLHPRSWPRSSAGKFSQGPRGTRVGTGAGFYGRKETKSSIPGSPGSRRQGAPVPQAASRTAALGSEALGGGRTIQAARTARPPAPHRSPRSRHWGARSRRGGRRVVPALGQPPPRALADPRQGRRVGPDCRSVYLRGAAEERGRALGPRSGSRRAAVGRAGVVAERLTLASRGSPAGGAGCAWGFGAHAASGCTVPIQCALPQAGAPSSSGARTPLGALSPAGSAWAPGAHPAGHTHRGRSGTSQARAAEAAPGVAGCQHHPSPRLRQGKKDS